MVLHRLFIICKFLVVLVFLYSSLIILTSFSPRLPLVFFWGMQVSIRGIFVFLFAQIVSLSLDMFYLMNPCFLTHMCFLYPLPLPHPLVYIPLCSLLFLLLLQRLHLSLYCQFLFPVCTISQFLLIAYTVSASAHSVIYTVPFPC
jgi:hypothetical protein